MRNLFRFLFLMVSFFGTAATAQTSSPQTPSPQPTAPRLLRPVPFAPRANELLTPARGPVLPLPLYFYSCRHMFFYFPSGAEFSKTIEAKNNINQELDAIYSTGKNDTPKMQNLYRNMISSIIADLEHAPKTTEIVRVVLTFERALGSVEECGRALDSWLEVSPQIEAVFGNYYLQSQRALNDKFQSISQSRYTRNSIEQTELFISDFQRSKFITPELSQAIKPKFDAGLARIEMARAQYSGTYFKDDIINPNECIVEDDALRPTRRLDTERLYPIYALSRNISGEVVVQLTIDKSGFVTDAVFASATDDVFRTEAIIRAFRQLRFYPKITSCETKPITITQKLVFRVAQ